MVEAPQRQQVGAFDKSEWPARHRDISQIEPGFVAGEVDVAVKLGLRVVFPRVFSLCEMFDLGVPNEVTEFAAFLLPRGAPSGASH